MNKQEISAVIAELSPKERDALIQAVERIYFNDRADYLRGLYSVVRALVGDKVDVGKMDFKNWFYVLDPSLESEDSKD